MKSLLLLIIICVAIVSLLPLSTSSESVALMNGIHQQEAQVLARAGTMEIASYSTLPDLPPNRGQSQHDTLLEPGTILLFGMGLIGLSFQWKLQRGSR
jgi:hypothetical protein